MLEKYSILQVKITLLFTFYTSLNLSGHMTENKVVSEKKMQNLLICLWNKAVGIHAFTCAIFI